MSWIAVAIGGSAVLGYMGSQNAASAESNAANNATATSQGEFNTEQATEAPYVQAGNQALGQIQGNMASYNQPFTMSQFQQDPGYQFDLQQGQQSLDQSAAASGGIVSGAQMAALSNYSQNMASNEYGNAFNRYQSQIQNSYNRLAGVAQLGQGAAANTGSAAIQTGANIGNAQMAAGNAQAAGYVGGANAITGGVNSYLNYSSGQNLVNAIGSRYAGAGGSQGVPGASDLSGSSELQMPEAGSEFSSLSNY